MELKSKKIPQHRQAIAKAASIEAAIRPSVPETHDTPKRATVGVSKGATVSLSSTAPAMNGGKDIVVAPDTSDDYEGCKITKNKRFQYDDDVRMVKDLDRWG